MWTHEVTSPTIRSGAGAFIGRRTSLSCTRRHGYCAVRPGIGSPLIYGVSPHYPAKEFLPLLATDGVWPQARAAAAAWRSFRKDHAALPEGYGGKWTITLKPEQHSSAGKGIVYSSSSGLSFVFALASPHRTFAAQYGERRAASDIRIRTIRENVGNPSGMG